MLKNFNPLTWLISSILLSLGILSIGFFMLARPNQIEAAAFIDAKAKFDAEAAKRSAVERRYKNAEALVQELDSRWQEIVSTKTPGRSVQSGGIDLSQNRWQLTVDSRRFRNSIQLAVNNQMRKGGVKVITGPTIPNFSENAADIVETGYNYPALGFPVVIYDLGSVTVEGTFDQIAANVESWSNMPNYMVVADGLSLTGTSPVLRGTYNLTLVGYIRSETVAPPVPEVATTANGGGAPGGGQAGGPPRPGGAPPAGAGAPGGGGPTRASRESTGAGGGGR